MFLIFSLVLFLLSCTVSTTANTEILNFEASLSNYVEIGSLIDWPILDPRDNERLLHINATPRGQDFSPKEGPCAMSDDWEGCQNEVWLGLALDKEHWSSFSKFTLRISWPANHPADFFIDIFSPEAVASHFSLQPVVSTTTAKTRVKYARIRVLHTGVIVPALSHIRPKPVPFVVTLEGLYFGVLPESVVPIVIYLALTLLGLYFVVPRVVKCVEQIAREVRTEVAVSKPRHKSE